MAPMDLSKLQTETRNPRSASIDRLSSLEICELINREDATVASAVGRCLPVIAAAVDALAERVRCGGRVFYVGAGTSGRLGVLDASEIPPTYSAPTSQFVALMAGGDAAIRHAQEGAEDRSAAAEPDLSPYKLDPSRDSLIGIAASGQTPYVLGCLAYAKRIGCATVGVACCSPSKMDNSGLVDYMIVPVTGPEVVTGSTRMKAGTATKLVLNTLSTAVMIRVGKTFGNMMVDLKPSNEKLRQRSRNIIRSLSGGLAPSSDAQIDGLVQRCGNSVKLALTVIHTGCSPDEASARLDSAGGILADAIKDVSTPSSGQKNLMDASNLVLCIDGGATKCAAVVMNSTHRIGHGQVGPCNVTDVDIPTAVSTIALATHRALEDLARRTGSHPVALGVVKFGSIWIGLAGYERANLQPRINAALAKLFRTAIGPGLRVTADIDLLASALSPMNKNTRSCIVLVAGTGSIAMRYAQRDRVPVRISRSGGWGHLLGDDGSGFDLGREALRHTMMRLDEVANRTSKAVSLGLLATTVLEHFQPQEPDQWSSASLLSEVMVPAASDTPTDHRTRIAAVGRLVLEAAPQDPDAEGIMQEGVKGLMRTVLPLCGPGDGSQSLPALVLGGGLMQNTLYREALLEELRKAGMQFEGTHLVHNPALAGGEFLRARIDAPLRAKL